MKNLKTEGIVIKRRNFGETDRIITVFSKKLGKIQIKAPGVRKINSRRSPYTELFNHCVFTLYKGKSMFILTEISELNIFSKIKEDLKKVGFAYHVCELIDGLCAENQENQAVFSLFNDTLKNLSNSNDPVSLVIRNFEIKLLENLGFYKENLSSANLDTTAFIEQVLERSLRVRQIIPRFS